MTLHFCVEKNEEGLLLRDFLRNRGVSLSLIRSAKTHGGFFANNLPILANRSVKEKQIIYFSLPIRQSENVQCQQIPFKIIYEDEHLMAIDKPAGTTIHPTWGYVNNTLANAFCGEMQNRGTPMPFRAINRIDKNTSGIVLCAMNEYATPLLAKSSCKIYLAVVQGKTPQSGEINLPIGLKEDSFIVRCVTQSGKESITKYKTLWQNNTHSLVAVRTVTGRTHQIRVHFSHLGYPLAGDDMYGGDIQLINRQALHCALIEIDDIKIKYGVECKEVLISNLPYNTEQINNKLKYEQLYMPFDSKKTKLMCNLPTDMKCLLPKDMNITKLMENIGNYMM